MSYDTDWHYVGEVGEPAFENDAYNTGTGLNRLRFRKTPGGFVVIQGAINSPAQPYGKQVFTLPEGYRTDKTYLPLPYPHQGLCYIANMLLDGGVRPYKLFGDMNFTFYVGDPTIGEDGADGADGNALGFDVYSSATTYGENAIVASMGIAYLSVQGSNTNHTPGTDTAWWKEAFKITSAYDVYAGGSASVENTDNVIDGGTV